MATDTARVQLELASGRSEITAPFQQTAQRRRKQLEQDAASVDAPVDAATPTQVVVAIPLASPARANEAPPRVRESATRRPPGTARPPWIAFIAALIAVAVGVWWVMSQRMPDIDPREVIARNLDEAAAAMADGRYTDPPERSAFHYYSTVLALDPKNADAIAGIDAIADRHLTNARVLLANGKLAEAGVALEKARRVNPEQEGLAALDKQWRGELQEILAASIATAKPVPEPVAKPPIAKSRNPVSPPSSVEPASSRERVAAVAAAPKIETSPPPQAAGSAPDVKNETVVPVADLTAIAAALATTQPSRQLATAAVAPAPEMPAVTAPGAGAKIIHENAAVAAPAAPVSAERKRIKMVEPEYPPEALMRGLGGWVDVSLRISPAGDVIEPRVEKSSRGRMFNRAALSAVEQWKYEPRSDGTTSERVLIRLRFQQGN